MTTMTAYGDMVFNLAHMDFKGLEDGVSYVLTPTTLRINYGPGDYDIFTGTGLTYDDDGYPVGGSITAFTGYEDGSVYFRISGTGIAASKIAAAAKTASTSDDQAIFRAILAGHDTLTGARKSDTINGYNGNDEITGNGARDFLTGGAGYDDFNYRLIGDTKTGAGRDRITDFTHGADDIDLSAIDANGTASGNGSFVFLATKGASFTGVRGQLRWSQYDYANNASDKTIIDGDVNGDAVADFQIELAGLVSLSAGDFIL